MPIFPANLKHLFNDAKDYLNKSDYHQTVELLEQCIEADEENVNYYWYLGLAYLLQGQEEKAQTTWLLVMSQGNDEEVVQWTQELLTILEVEALRQENIENLKLSWLIRGHIREIEPNLINNLLHLIDLEIKLQYYEPEHLENWQIVDFLKNNVSETIDSELFLKILPDILETPACINLDLLYAYLKYVTDSDALISILQTVALKIAEQYRHYNYAVELTTVSLILKPNDLDLLDKIYRFNVVAKNYPEVFKLAEKYLRNATTAPLKIIGYYKIIYAHVIGGGWLEINEVLPLYTASLQTIITSEPESIEEIILMVGNSMPSLLMYLEDNPLLYRQIQNQFSKIFNDFTNNEISYAKDRKKINFIFPRKLKIGYIAHTFRRHSVGWLSRWLIHYHDREQFEIVIYCIGRLEDDITQFWFKQKVDLFHSFPEIPEKIVGQIQQDEIDILVDLDSLSKEVTCKVLALKPAPIQVTWLGYDSSGLPTVDYFVADRYILPDNAQDYYQEMIWRLPQTYLAVDGFEVAVPSLKREDLGISSDSIIYMNMQSSHKQHPDTIRLQLQILQAVPNSYLLIKPEGDHKILQNLFEEMAKEYQIDWHRIRFLERAASEEVHRANLTIADVILDTYPYNGATTTLEALWLEIPLVTKVGQQCAARNSYTFMINAGLTEGIAWTDEEYINWGIRLGKDENLRKQISWKLRKSKKTAPVWNAKQFTQDMEIAYQQMWLKYLES